MALTTTATAAAYCVNSGQPVHEGDTDTWSHYRCDCGADVPTTSMGDDVNVAGWRYLDPHQRPGGDR